MDYTRKDEVIDKDEYNETIQNLERIKEEALLYVEKYIKQLKTKNVLTEEAFARKYKYSTLKYFHKELGIE